MTQRDCQWKIDVVRRIDHSLMRLLSPFTHHKTPTLGKFSACTSTCCTEFEYPLLSSAFTEQKRTIDAALFVSEFTLGGVTTLLHPSSSDEARGK
mmetsp:Transcript_2978/g.11405  ORF Transcript_2978/g.11405 Transcript_2978/m.11405 type:complete len:95 (+) Transcript_2978:4571-4855(+)